MATPSLAMIPSAYADSKVYSVLPNNGDGDFTFNRDSSATRVGQNGLIQEVGFFGNEEVTNGDFATDSDWSKGTGWTISGGKANVNATSNTDLAQDVGSSIGKTYKITFEISNYVTGSAQVLLGYGSTPISPALIASANGIYEVEATANAVNPQRLYISTKTATTQLSIDNVSVKEVTGDQPRLNYDISNGVVQSCPSLLLEPASTNLITYSEDFSQSAWTKSNTAITSNSVISPDGTLNASTLTDNTANGIHRLRDSVSLSASTDYSLSVFAKKGTLSNIQLALINTANSSTSSRVFDLENGVLGESLTNQTLSNSKITDYGNGWFKCEITAQLASTPNTYQITLATKSSGNATNVSQVTYDGDGTGNVYIFGAQVETSYPTSYIPTNGSSQTRAAESCYQTVPDGIIGQTEGVIFLDVKMPSVIQSNTTFSINGGTSGEYAQLEIRSDLSINWRYRQGGTDYINENVGSYVGGDRLKLAFAYKSGSSILYKNGVSIATDNGSIGSNSWNNVYFSNFAGTGKLNASVKQISLYNTRLTNAQLQTLTTL